MTSLPLEGINTGQGEVQRYYVTTFTPVANTKTTISVATSGPVGRTFFSIIAKGAPGDVITVVSLNPPINLERDIEYLMDVTQSHPTVKITSSGDMSGTLLTNSIEQGGVPIIVTVGNEATKVGIYNLV